MSKATTEDWKRLCQEVEAMGFEKASPIAQLVYSCETGRGIDQHASVALYHLIDDALELARLRRIEKAAEMMAIAIHLYKTADAVASDELSLDDALAEYEAAKK